MNTVILGVAVGITDDAVGEGDGDGDTRKMERMQLL